MKMWEYQERSSAAPLGSRTVRENFHATIPAGARPRRRSLSLIVHVTL